VFLYSQSPGHEEAKVRHHWGSRKSKCKVATLYKSCSSLSNGKQRRWIMMTTTPTSINNKTTIVKRLREDKFLKKKIV
jgi:hypothetical protein